jgi:hypothetical protein
MPWKVSGVVERWRQFAREYETGEWTMTELCRAYEISRPTGYALWHRYESAGRRGWNRGTGRRNGIPTRRCPRSRSGCWNCGGRTCGGGRANCKRIWSASGRTSVGRRRVQSRDCAVGRAGDGAQETTQGAAVHTTVSGSAGAEPVVACGFQRFRSFSERDCR